MKTEDLDELWVPIPGYPNYEVSSLGEVINVTTGKVLTPFVEPNGRVRVTLYVLGKRKKFYIHRLVAQAFFLNYTGDDCDIRHINYNYQDNTVLNLRIGASSRKKK